MTVPFRRGEPVRLTPKFAEALNRAPQHRVNWKERTGTVTRCNAHSVYVNWDDLCPRSVETLPLQAIERVMR